MRKPLAITIAIILFFTIVSTNVDNINAASKTNVAEDVAKYDIAKNCTKDTAMIPNMTHILTYFNCGHVTTFQNGTTLRNFTLVIEESHKLPISLPVDTQKSIMFPAWTFNSSIPGPTLRVTQGDHVEINVLNRGTMPHSLHMHSIHPGAMDGVPIVSGESGFIPPGKQFTYKFTANPVGIFPYHCHMIPITEHINRGLYGGLIIDPPFDQARPAAHEIVMYLNGYDLNLKSEFPRMPTVTEANAIMSGNESVSEALPQEHDNQLYSVNGIANYYMHHPIPVALHQPLRIYMFNMLDFEENSFHLHGQVYSYYPSGTSKSPSFTNDMLTMAQGDRGILETQFDFPGLYMAHAHFEQVGGRGWSSLFSVR